MGVFALEGRKEFCVYVYIGESWPLVISVSRMGRHYDSIGRFG